MHTVPVVGLAGVAPNPVPPNKEGAVEAGAVPKVPNGVAVKLKKKGLIRCFFMFGFLIFNVLSTHT